jgi:hypothetical protein
MEIQVYETETGKGCHIVEIQAEDKHIIVYLACEDELYDLLQRLPDIYSVLRFLENLADDIMTDINYHRVVEFMREHKKTACRVLIRNQGFYALEPINL